MTSRKIKFHVFRRMLFARFSAWFTYNITQMFTRKKEYVVPTYASTHDIITALDYGNLYKSDPNKGHRDVMYHVTHAQRHIATGKGSMDCDDYACYWLYTLLKSGLAKRAWLGVLFFLRNDKFEGHAIAVFEGQDGKMYWADYTDPNPFVEEWGWAKASVAAFGGQLLVANIHEVVRITKNGCLRFARGSVKNFHG